MTREQAEKIVNDHRFCHIHNVPMEEYGEADLCGTYPTRCPVCSGDWLQRIYDLPDLRN
jgi:hypothetical protein